MPQLDVNTFIYQYFSIILVLSTTYAILSYIVLPALLRIILIRSKWTFNASFVNSDVSSKLNSVNEASLLQLTRVNYAQTFIASTANLVYAVLSTFLFASNKKVASNKKILNKLINFNYLTYLSLYLITLELNIKK